MSKIEFGNKATKLIGNNFVNVKITDLKPCIIQRQRNKGHVNNLVNNFDERKFGIISVVSYKNKNDDDYEIIDGMHRIEALKIIANAEGHDARKILVPCQVYEVENDLESFQIFRSINTGRRKLYDRDFFIALMHIEGSSAYELNKILERVHINLEPLKLNYGDVKLGGINRLIKWFNNDEKLGVKTVEDGLRLLRIAVSQRRGKSIKSYDIETIEAYARAGGDIKSAHVLDAVKKAGDELFINDQSKINRLIHFTKVLDSYMAFTGE